MFSLFRKQGLIPGHPELKPCPFCGETRAVIEDVPINGESNDWQTKE